MSVEPNKHNDICQKHMGLPGHTWGQCNYCVSENTKTSQKRLREARDKLIAEYHQRKGTTGTEPLQK